MRIKKWVEMGAVARWIFANSRRLSRRMRMTDALAMKASDFIKDQARLKLWILIKKHDAGMPINDEIEKFVDDLSAGWCRITDSLQECLNEAHAVINRPIIMKYCPKCGVQND